MQTVLQQRCAGGLGMPPTDGMCTIVASTPLDTRASVPAGVRRACQPATAGRSARRRTLFVVRAAPACAGQGEAHPAPAAPRLLRRQALAAAAAAAAGLALSPAAQAAEACELVKAPNGMQFCDLVEGTGDSPVAGAMIRWASRAWVQSCGARAAKPP